MVNCNILFKFSRVWSGSLGRSATVKHHVDLKPDSRVALQHSRRARVVAREHKGGEADQMLKEVIFERAMSGGLLSVLFPSKKDGKLRFRVDYRKPTAMTVCDTYTFSQMDECIDWPGDTATLSWDVCNRRY